MIGTESLSENMEGSCFRAKGRMARREEGAYPSGSVTDEPRSQAALGAKTLRAASLLAVSSVGSTVETRTTAHNYRFARAPAAGMCRLRRLGHHQNPLPQDPFLFSDRL